MKVALVHDWLNQMGGAERVLLTLKKVYPDAPIFTSIYGPDLVDDGFRAADVRTSVMQKLPGVLNRHRWYLPVFPVIFDRMRLDGFDVVISNASAFCKAVRLSPTSLHICYCLTPTRFVWNPSEYLARENMSIGLRVALVPVLSALRRWDRGMAKRVDRFVTISKSISARVKQLYGRDSEIIYPPVDTDSFSPSNEVEDYYLVVSRLAPYKRIDLAVSACTRLNARLKVIGAGRDRPALESIAGPTVEFEGRADDETVKHHLARCKALIFPGEEDFGIVPLEAQASGRPVIAYGAGGALETVIPGRTGEFFTTATVESLAAALRDFDHTRYSRIDMTTNAKCFAEPVFIEKLANYVRDAYAQHASGRSGGRSVANRSLS